MSRIYVASSWRNDYQPEVVKSLRVAGHKVYDFRNPLVDGPVKVGARGVGTDFQWSEIEPDWQYWNAVRFRRALEHPVAEAGFKSDFDAMEWADTCVLVLPCGRSAHLELGWAVGRGKRTAILLAGKNEPELMYKMVDKLALTLDELVAWLALERILPA